MLKITVPMSELYDEVSGKFIVSGYDLELEHSLASLSKWESEFEKPFFSKDDKSAEETLFYIKHCMLVTKNPPEEIFQKLSKGNFDQVQNYINAKRSATWFAEQKSRPGPANNQIITSAVIYGWMVELKIPFETQHWHLNELFTLIRVCNEQRKTPKKMGRAEALRQQATLNAQRQAQMGTRG